MDWGVMARRLRLLAGMSMAMLLCLAGASAAQAATITAADQSASEGNVGSPGQIVFTLQLSDPAPVGGTTLKVQTATGGSGNPASLADFSAVPLTTLTVPEGEDSVQVPVDLVGDALHEPNETFLLQWQDASDGSPNGQAVGTILDDDDPPTVSIADAQVTESTGTSTTMVFQVSLSAVSGTTATVDWATSDGTATTPADYTAASGTVSFPPGTTTQTVSVTVAGDAIDEPDETFDVTLSNPVEATLGDATAVGKIVDNDPTTITVADPTPVTEGNSGNPGQITFMVHLSAPATVTTTVEVHTSSVTAISSVDYVAVPNTTLQFNPGEQDKPVVVTLVGDAIDEQDETFTLQLANSSTGSPQTFATGKILDDDDPPTVSVADAQVTEQSNATSLIAFKVSLSSASGKTIQLKWATSNGTAIAPGDYTAASNTMTFSPGTISQNITVQIVGDTLDEADETFNVTLSDPDPPTDVNATITDGQAVGTIVDDDGPNVSVTSTSVTEGPAGVDQVARLTVTLSALSPQPVSVAYATADATATAPDDYDAITGDNRLTIPAGQLFATIDVTVHGDGLDESDETVNLNLTSPQGGTITTATGVVTILDDDATPGIVASGISVNEGTGGSTNAVLTVGLTAPSAKALSAAYKSVDGSATAGVDYAAQDGSLAFAAGETSKQITIPIGPDSEVEENETFTLNITNTADGGGIVPVTVTIVDDDLTSALTPTVSISDGTPALERDSGQSQAVFTVRLDQSLTRHVSVHYASRSGTAKSPQDFMPIEGTVSFAPGETSKELVVQVNGDKELEGNEDYSVVLTSPVNAKLGKDSGQGIIVDDDAGAGSLVITPKKVKATALLCRRGAKRKSCSGMTLRWTALTSGTIDVTISAMVPAKSKKTTKKSKSKAKPKQRKLVLIKRSLKVKSGKGHMLVRSTGTKALKLRRQLHAAKVKELQITASFTNRRGARETARFTVPLRS